MSREILSQQPRGQVDDAPDQVLVTIPQKNGDTVVEIALVHTGDGATNIELRSLVWGHGLGWYRQHTLQLDGTTARYLIQALSVVQRREERQATDALAHKILPFPRRHHPDTATA
jgi:hypothetical protein